MTIKGNNINNGAGIKKSALGVFLAAGLFLGAGSTGAFGQGRFLFGIHGQGGHALGEFQNHLSSGVGGLNVEFLYVPFRAAPFTVGFSLGFLIYGVESYEEFFSSRYADFYIDMTTTNSIINGLFSARYHLGRGVVQPYVEGLAGFGIIRTDTSADDYDDGNQIEMENLSDSFWSFGAGSGVMIRVLQVQNQRGRRLMEGMIDVRFRYLNGGRAEFLMEGGIRREGDRLIYDILKSRTDLWMVQAGILLKF